MHKFYAIFSFTRKLLAVKGCLVDETKMWNSTIIEYGKSYHFHFNIIIIITVRIKLGISNLVELTSFNQWK